MIQIPFLPIQILFASIWMAVVAGRIRLNRRRQSSTGGSPANLRRRCAASLLLMLYLQLVLQLILAPLRINLGGLPRIVNLTPVVESLLMLEREPLLLSLYNLVGNFALLLPLGILLPLLSRRCHSAPVIFAAALSLSAAIESLQWLTGGRIFDIDDIILNSAGAVAGYALGRVSGRWLRALRREQSERSEVAGDALHPFEGVGKEALVGRAEAVR